MEDAITPPTIPDQSVPLINGGTTSVFGTTTDPITSGAETPDKAPNPPIPQAIVATDTVSTSINTETKKISGEYEFEQLGAFKVGDFKQNVSGEVKFSPDGIVATNKEGEESFRLDGETGDATFAGTVKAKDFVIADKDGLVSLASFKSDEAIQSSSVSTTSTTLSDLSGASLVLPEFKRAVKLMVFFTSQYYVSAIGAFQADGVFVVQLDGAGVNQTQIDTLWDDKISGERRVETTHAIITVQPGAHTLKVQWKTRQLGGATATLWSVSRTLSYIVLGN